MIRKDIGSVGIKIRLTDIVDVPFNVVHTKLEYHLSKRVWERIRPFNMYHITDLVKDGMDDYGVLNEES